MSGFDDNPFGEPLDNPFADPSVQQVTKNSTTAQSGLEDFNPFADQLNPQTPSNVRGAANPPQYHIPSNQQTQQPAVMQPTQEPPPAYSKNAQQQVTTAELQRRQDELERKAQELARREEELRNPPYNVRKNNWPPLPERFCVQPCFYQDITVDIPLEFQRVVRLLYYLWMFHACVLVLNVLGGLSLMVTGATGGATTFGLSILFLILFTPSSYLCWFRPAYKAFKSDSSFNFMIFFFIMFFQLIVSVLMAIGITSLGTCGFVVGIGLITKSDATASTYTVGTIVLIIALCFAMDGFGVFMLLLKVHRIYRTTGASFAKAQQEFTSGVLRNEHVQSAAGDITASAVRNQMSQSSSRY